MKGYIRRGITWFTVIVMTLTVLPARIVAGTLDETLDFASATQNVSGDGYTWDNEAKTLKLEDLTLNVDSGDGIILPDGAVLTLSGNNKITTQAGSLIRANGNLTIDGGGTLEESPWGKTTITMESRQAVVILRLENAHWICRLNRSLYPK